MDYGEAVRIPLWIDLAAVAVGALQGASVATAKDERNEYDFLAGITFALVVGLGGGILRDVLLNLVPAALQNDWYVITAAIAGVVGMALGNLIGRVQLLVDILDSAALALFVLVGVLKANDAGLGPAAAVLLGTITGVGGGVIRDLMAARPVQVLQRTVPYAIVAIVGAAVFELLTRVGLAVVASAAVAFAVMMALRIVAILTGWRTPPPPVVGRRGGPPIR